jgi:hypothetical protein
LVTVERERGERILDERDAHAEADKLGCTYERITADLETGEEVSA